MLKASIRILLLALPLYLGLTQAFAQSPTPITASTAQTQIANRLGLDATQFESLLNKRLYEMQPQEVSQYLRFLQSAEPDLRKRISDLARKNIGQPYLLFPMGEFPYELHDPQPMFSLAKSDCVTFAEHIYAMALSASWDEFFWTLQRIRYKEGVIGVVTRNHYTEADWNPSNAWLLRDISRVLAGANAATYTMVIDRAQLLKTRYQLARDIPVQTVIESYVAKNRVADIENQLQEGDIVNVISGRNGEKLTTHVGIVVLGPNGKRHMIHSSEPMVREETFDSFIQRAADREARGMAQGRMPLRLYGFKFLRLNEKPEVPLIKPQPRPGWP